MFRPNEIVYTGNSFESSQANGRINRYNSANGYVEIANGRGVFTQGDLIFGLVSGFSVRLSEFTYKKIDPPDGWDEDFITLDTGELVSLTDHNNDYDKTYMVVLE